jgi:hypothetical protein
VVDAQAAVLTGILGRDDVLFAADPNTLIAKTGGVWKSRGWYLFERDDFRKPNRFSYAPDGYSLQIKGKSQPGYPPSLEGLSPCFPAALPNDRRSFLDCSTRRMRRLLVPEHRTWSKLYASILH